MTTDTPRAESLQEIERLVLEYGQAAYNDGDEGRQDGKNTTEKPLEALLSAITSVVQERDKMEKALLKIRAQTLPMGSDFGNSAVAEIANAALSTAEG